MQLWLNVICPVLRILFSYCLFDFIIFFNFIFCSLLNRFFIFILVTFHSIYLYNILFIFICILHILNTYLHVCKHFKGKNVSLISNIKSNLFPVSLKNSEQKYQEWCSHKGFGCVCDGHCGSVHDETREHEGVRAEQYGERYTQGAGEKQPVLHVGGPNMNSICRPHNTSGCTFMHIYHIHRNWIERILDMFTQI